MMQMTGTKTESQFQKDAISLIEKMGGYVIKVHVSAYQSQGEPDLICCYCGRFIAFELKVGKNRTSKLQRYKIKQIIAAGGIAKPAYNLLDIEETLYEVNPIQSGGKSE